MGRGYNFVSSQIMLLIPEFLDQSLQARALGMPAHQTGAGFFMNAEQIELLAQLAVIAFGCFFLTPFVGFQIRFLLPGGSVDSLQHGPFFVAPPIGTGHRQEFHRFRIDVAR